MDELLVKQSSPFTVPNILPLAIFSTICCCVPLGIMAIIYIEKALSYSREGDFEEARIQTRMAKLWLTWAFVLGIGFHFIHFVFSLLPLFSFAL